jgi:hypothetical protein
VLLDFDIGQACGAPEREHDISSSQAFGYDTHASVGEGLNDAAISDATAALTTFGQAA